MKFTKIIAMMLAAVLFCTMFATAALAEDNTYEEQLQKFEEMKNRKIAVTIDVDGLYALKSSKFYAREIKGVNPDGSFILGGWECLYSDTNVPMSVTTLSINGTYAVFGYSCDILWGTNFPYSDVFWSDVNTPVKTIKIMPHGTVRDACMSIYVNNEQVFYDFDCDSHSEWRPC